MELTLASVSSILLGAAAAGREGPIHWQWLALTLFGVVAIEVAKNAAGEIRDFDSGADANVAPEDRSPFSGGRRVLIDRLLTRRETTWISAVAYGAGIVSGLVIAMFREPAVLGVGLAGVALAWFYYAPPFRLAYRGWGELAVGLAYGPVICCGTYLVQQNRLSCPVFWLSLPLGLLIAAFLWINEFPDYKADLKAGKKTMVVRLGRARASYAFAAIVAGAFGLQAALPAFALPSTIWLGLIALPLGILAGGIVLRSPEVTARIIPAQAWTLLAFVGLSLASAVGLIWRF